MRPARGGPVLLSAPSPMLLLLLPLCIGSAGFHQPGKRLTAVISDASAG
jgi:hypothetical protein